MPNPGTFRGTRLVFLDSQADIYAEGIRNNQLADTVADIQRRYFKRYPMSLEHNVEPTQEWLDGVDDAAADPEIQPPNVEVLSNGAYSKALEEYNRVLAETKARKDSIKRRLAYVYSKNCGKDASFDVKGKKGSSDPLTALKAKLAGVELKTPRMRTAYNVWGPQNRSIVDPIYNKRVQEGSVPAKEQLALHSSIYKELFEELPEAEQKKWTEIAKRDHDQALEGLKIQEKKAAMHSNSDYQRVISALPSIVQPILDLLCEYTGWKFSMHGGGPEPADGGRLNMIFMHSGVAPGSVSVDFGGAERETFKKSLMPAFGRYMKRCYNKDACMARALPANHGTATLADVRSEEGTDVALYRVEYDKPTPKKRLFEQELEVLNKGRGKAKPPTGTPSPMVRFGPPIGKKKDRMLPTKDNPASLLPGPSKVFKSSPLSQAVITAEELAPQAGCRPFSEPTASQSPPSPPREDLTRTRTPIVPDRVGATAVGLDTGSLASDSDVIMGDLRNDAQTSRSHSTTTEFSLPSNVNTNAPRGSASKPAPIPDEVSGISTPHNNTEIVAAEVVAFTADGALDCQAIDSRTPPTIPDIGSSSGSDGAPSPPPSPVPSRSTSPVGLCPTLPVPSYTTLSDPLHSVAPVSSHRISPTPLQPIAPIPLRPISPTPPQPIASIPLCPILPPESRSTLPSPSHSTSPIPLCTSASGPFHSATPIPSRPISPPPHRPTSPTTSHATSPQASPSHPTPLISSCFALPVLPHATSPAPSYTTSPRASFAPSYTNSPTPYATSPPSSYTISPVPSYASLPDTSGLATPISSRPILPVESHSAPLIPSRSTTLVPSRSPSPILPCVASSVPLDAASTAPLHALPHAQPHSTLLEPRCPTLTTPPSPQAASTASIQSPSVGGITSALQAASLTPTPPGAATVPTFEDAAVAPDSPAARPTSSHGTKKRAGSELEAVQPPKKQRTGLDVTRAFLVPSATGCPKWASSAVDFLAGDDLGPSWRRVVALWVSFEAGYGFDEQGSRLLARGRPAVVSDWIKRARNPRYRPTIDNLVAFGDVYASWWRSVQPDWRLSDASTSLNRADGDWNVIQCSGVNGLLSALAALFFWGVALGNERTASIAWNNAVEDAVYVLESIM